MFDRHRTSEFFTSSNQGSGYSHSQTQEDGGAEIVDDSLTMKRKVSVDESQKGPRKKNKISLAPAVDLET